MIQLLIRSGYFAYLDVARQFKLSFLGPLWLVVSTIVISILIFSVLSGLSLGKSGYSDLVVGLHIWACFSNFILESMNTFVNSSGLLRNTRIGLLEVYVRFFCSQIIKMLMTCALIGAYISVFHEDLVSGLSLTAFPIIFSPILFFIGFSLSISGARFRDLISIVSIALQILFYATPILWTTSMLPISPYWNQFNLVYHIIEWVRNPEVLFLIKAVGFWTTLFCALFFVAFRRFKQKVVYWV